MTIPSLPVEIHVAILAALPSSKHDPSERTLLNYSEANSILRAAVQTSTVWKTPYQVRYTHCDEGRERLRHESCGGDWRELYLERRRLDREALALVDAIRTKRVGRHPRARQLVRAYGFDVWDALREETRLPVPAWVGSSEPVPPSTGGPGAPPPRDALPRRYWSQVVLGVIARHDLMGVWAKTAVANQQEVDFETALAGLSTFFDVSVKEVIDELDEVCTACRDHLIAKGISLDPSSADYDFWNLCISIRTTIHEQGFCLAQGPAFYRVTNQFPHAFLKPANRTTIPISLVYVFVAVARRLGIQASPANFPGVVQAHIQPPDGGPAKLLDIRGDNPPAHFPTASFSHLGPTVVQSLEEHTSPATPATMLTRSCSNIRMFVQQEMMLGVLPRHNDYDMAFYANTCWRVLSAADHIHDLVLSPPTPDLTPLDYATVFIDGMCTKLLPALQAAFTQHIEMCLSQDEESHRVVKTRTDSSRDVQYFVGMPLVHKKYKYAAVIYGWDPKCMASEGWIESMQVNLLRHGRLQPFYHVVPLNRQAQPRYVAQENITPARINVWKGMHQSHPLFRRYFVDMERDSTTSLTRLKVSQELLEAYPDDDAYAAEWIRTEKTEVHSAEHV